VDTIGLIRGWWILIYIYFMGNKMLDAKTLMQISRNFRGTEWTAKKQKREEEKKPRAD